MKINQWAVVMIDANAYLDPLLTQQGIVGNVENSPRFPDGDNITTSAIVGKRSIDNGFSEWGVVTKSGNVYLLGEVLPDYEKHYPDARSRLFNSLPEV